MPIDDEPIAGFADVTPDLPEPENFDLDAWLEGVRPTRRAVLLYGRSDVIARMEEIAGTIGDSPDDDVDEMVEEFERLKAAFLDSGRWFVVEARSPEWVDDYRRAAKKDLGITKKDDPTERQKVSVLLGQLAQQIVTPHGVTVTALERLHETAPGELNKLIVAMTYANEQLSGTAKVLSMDFSSRRSGAVPD